MPARGEDFDIGDQHSICPVVFSRKGHEVLGCDSGGRAWRWKAQEKSKIDEAILVEGAVIFAAALSPDCSWLVCGVDAPPYARVWATGTYHRMADLDDHTDTVLSVDVSFSSKKIVTGGADKRAFIWSVTGHQVERLAGPLEHGDRVLGVQFSPRADQIATVSDDKFIRIFGGDNACHELLITLCPFDSWSCPPLAWSDGAKRLFAVSTTGVKSLDTSTGYWCYTWSPPVDASYQPPSFIALSHNQKFMVVVVGKSLTFWDIFTDQRIGPVIKRRSAVRSITLSPTDDCIVIVEDNGKVTWESIRDILLVTYLPSDLPLMSVDDEVFRSWAQGNLTRARQLLTNEIRPPADPHHALANRALVLSRLKRYSEALADADWSAERRSSTIGHIALFIARSGNGEHDSAASQFMKVVAHSSGDEKDLLLSIRSILQFERARQAGNFSGARDCICDFKNGKNDNLLYVMIEAQMHLLLASMALRMEDHAQTVQSLRHARAVLPMRQRSPRLLVLSLIFGWDFDCLDYAIERQIQRCINHFKNPSMVSNHQAAIEQYSSILSLKPFNHADLLIKRSEVYGRLGQWKDSLRDADEAILAQPLNPWGYQKKHVALHHLKRYEEAIDAYSHMHSLMEKTLDQETHRKYISLADLKTAIDNSARDASKKCPLILIDVKSGCLCDEFERVNTLKSEPMFQELVSLMTLELKDKQLERTNGGPLRLAAGRYLKILVEFFKYETLSHVWQGKEPSYQDVRSVKSIWNLGPSQLNDKLRKFCEIVREDHVRWAWSDTVCIDKTNSKMLYQALKMMYRCYKESAATIVFLADVDPLSHSAIHNLKDSKWLKRAWTSPELLASATVRFYDCKWQRYLGKASHGSIPRDINNDKTSPQILAELTISIGLPEQIIANFSPKDLSIRKRLQISSTREATEEEDHVYSQIGIFESDIWPHYGEGYAAALGHLIEETVARSGEVEVLEWSGGKPSSYNSCLPATLEVYSQMPHESLVGRGAGADLHLSGPMESICMAASELPPVRFANRRLQLPCIIFPVTEATLLSETDGVKHYCISVSQIGSVAIVSSDTLSLERSCLLHLVYPWIRESRMVSQSDNKPVADSPDLDLVAQLAARLQREFPVLLLRGQQPHREFSRVATECRILFPGINPRIDSMGGVHTGVVEIL